MLSKIDHLVATKSDEMKRTRKIMKGDIRDR